LEQNNERIAIRVARNGILANFFLIIFKLVAGIVGHSAAMIADAAHSVSDMVGTVIIIIGVKISNKAPDKEHPYGHERFECVATLILALILGGTGVGIGYAGLRTIIQWQYETLHNVPEVIALVAAVVGIVVKEGMYWYTRAAAMKINSGALMADAWHSRSDALSSVGSFAGILGARMGFPILDAVAAVAISLFIIKVAMSIFMDAINKMTDRACDDETVDKMRETVMSHDAVKEIDTINTRLFGNKIYVDLEINVDGNMSLNDAHDLAEQIHESIEENFKDVKHCMVHVNPVDVRMKSL